MKLDWLQKLADKYYSYIGYACEIRRPLGKIMVNEDRGRVISDVPSKDDTSAALPGRTYFENQIPFELLLVPSNDRDNLVDCGIHDSLDSGLSRSYSLENHSVILLELIGR